MQRGQHQVTGLRRLDRDIRGFQVANLADHDDIGVLAQEGFHRGREIQADFVVHVDLVDARHVDFHRVLRGGYIAVDTVQNVQTGIQRNSLAAAGGSGHQHHAGRLFDHRLEALPDIRRHAELLEAHKISRLIEQSEHHRFAMLHRQGGHAHVQGCRIHTNGKPAILR